MNRSLIKRAIVTLSMLPTLALAAPGADVWEFWLKSNEQSSETIVHADWQQLLDRNLEDEQADGINLFAYSKVSDADKALLNGYINKLTSIDPRAYNKAEQHAYWINLYNALTIKVVLDKYPVESIRNIRFLTSPFGPWDKSFIEIAGEDLSLNDIEHRILRPIWQDPRVHFAVNCASMGCPNLQGKAFTAENTESLLEKGADEFINHSRAVSRVGDDLQLSSIFDWYGSDFGENETQVIDYLGEFLTDEKQALLQNVKKVDYVYDWALNEAK